MSRGPDRAMQVLCVSIVTYWKWRLSMNLQTRTKDVKFVSFTSSEVLVDSRKALCSPVQSVTVKLEHPQLCQLEYGKTDGDQNVHHNLHKNRDG